MATPTGVDDDDLASITGGHCVAFSPTLVRATALDEYDDGNQPMMGEIAEPPFR